MKSSPATIPFILLIAALLGVAGFAFFSNYKIVNTFDSSKNNKIDSLKTTKIEVLNLKSFFMPSGRYNETDLYAPDKNGEIDYSPSTKIMQAIFYQRQKDSDEYTATTAAIVGQDTTSVTTQFVNFHTNNEVKMTMVLSASQFINDGNIRTYIPDSSEILLKAPSINPNSIIQWSYKNNETIYNCKSWFTTMSISGVPKKTIEVERKVIRADGKIITWLDYYVQGIGFYMEYFIDSNGKPFPFLEFGKLKSSY